MKQYLPGKPTKWGIKAWGLTDSANRYHLKCDIYKKKKRNSTTRRPTRVISCTTTYRKFLGKMALYLFR